MGIFHRPKMPKVEATPVYAQQKTPDYTGGADDAARRTTDRVKAGQSTILTTPSGVGTVAPTASTELVGNNSQKKTLLGG